MNPINVICSTCGKDVLVEPEVYEDDEAIHSDCGGELFNWWLGTKWSEDAQQRMKERTNETIKL